MKRVGVIGGGISGLVSAYVLAKSGVEVILYEKQDYLGGHAYTVNTNGVDVDLGFMVFNRVTYPNMMELFESLGVEMELSDMSFAVSLDNGRGCEWGSRNGFSSLFAQKSNLLNPYFLQMIREILKFKDDVLSYLDMLENNPDIDRNETLGHFINSRGYSELFQKAYLVPICGSIWSCPSEGVLSFSAFSVLSFCRNHHLLQVLFGRPQWLTVRWRSQNYVTKVTQELKSRGCQIKTSCEVQSVSTSEKGCVVICKDGSQETYDGCVMAVHAPDALRILGDQATSDERRILGAFQYVYSDIFLHRDKNLMPKNPAAWSAWNFLGSTDNRVCVTYWLNTLQNLGETNLPFLVTLNPDRTPENTLLKWSTGHPVPSVAASKASSELDIIQGKRRIWFCGAYQGYGFHEDGLKAGMIAAHGVLGRCCALLRNPKHMVPSWTELGARLFVTRFLKFYISTGCLTLLEEGGTMFTFEGNGKECILKCVLRIHSPQFYWKIMTQADLGLADAYINGDLSFVDEDEGLLNFFLILIANRDLNASNSKLKKNRGWWTPILFTAGLASAKYFIEHVSRKNTLTQARRNISRHYDLSNELFALFLDETMTYSCAVFKNEDEDLKDAQLRKISLLIEKARIEKNHEILEIGCGWGSLAIEVVKRTGCKYTGITLSIEQLKLAEKRVLDAGLQDKIRFLLCDYRQLPKTQKYDRIISCEMIENVGHEYIEEFFGCCDSALADDGLFVLQFISIPDERYDAYRRSSDFIKEYIFPGGCLPSLSRITSAMVAASRFCVEHIENIGIHYYQTLRLWRKNFLERQSEILALGFNEKFIRTWEYYFDYCAAGFKSRTLGNYQVVFSRPGNTTTFRDPFKSWPSVC
ncbi:Cyclopropane-fatty-acyl-phospholipid synthase isoform 1 [Senna tora]|uniref:Cyclopropane-fatty-acyl-phospholipid synthase isoform 1 n=1 Tax=Senna tora TaxID=362788 RepID=A0A835CDD1_9FABA|nr:Cyclopropane-fatty-acyl-phospholipid synthase isoform 1 [Senna tora]